jgi:type II secretory pathway component PulF
MGIAFEDGLSSCRLFAISNHPMLVTGQETGRLDIFSLRIAGDADREVSWRLKQALRIVEPLTIVTLAALVAGLILAYMLPTIGMLEQLA